MKDILALGQRSSAHALSVLTPAVWSRHVLSIWRQLVQTQRVASQISPQTGSETAATGAQQVPKWLVRPSGVTSSYMKTPKYAVPPGELEITQKCCGHKRKDVNSPHRDAQDSPVLSL